MSRILLGGHRGLGCTDHNFYSDIRDIFNLPVENTAQSISMAFDVGASYIETDAVQSADGVIFVLHNIVPQDHFFGTTIPPQLLNKMTFSEIKKYTTGRPQNGQIATLAEVLDIVAQKAPKMAPDATPWKINIELKHLGGAKQNYEDNGFLKSVARVVDESPLDATDILYSGFCFHNIQEMSKLSPQSYFGMLFREPKDGDETGHPPQNAIYTDHMDDWAFCYLPFSQTYVDFAQKSWNDKAHSAARLGFMHPEITSVTPEMIDLMQARKLGLNVWAVFENLNKEREAVYKRVIEDAINKQVPLTAITDYLPQMKQLVQDFKLAA